LPTLRKKKTAQKHASSGPKSKPTFFSLFSGCGGLDKGFTDAGFQCVGATDSDPVAAQSHAKNFPRVRFWQGRIGKLDDALLSSYFGLTPERVDVLVGGPPCPPFSKSRFYRKDKPRALDDPNGAETIEGYLRVLRCLKPRAFVLENVKGLAYDVHRDALDSIIAAASREGYFVSVAVLNAADYGVPQIRERCFVLGSKSGHISTPPATHAKEAEPGKQPWVTAGAVLADLDTDENASDEGHFAGGRFNGLLKQIPPGDNYLYFTEKRGHPEPVFKWRSRYWSFLLKLSPAMPAWTIQARRSNNMGPFHWRSRILRIPEIKRLQTFPDDFYLAGDLEGQWRQVGNAVPPLLAKHVAEAVLETLATK
jgi:DNA (cytosine-5)-methyltransferase 1